MDKISGFLGIVAGIMQIVAYLDYNKSIREGRSKPNGSTWAIWAFIAVVSASTYVAIVGDWAKSVLVAVNTLLCIGTFVLALCLGRFHRPSAWDLAAFAIGIASTAVWFFLKSATNANLILQGAIIVGFVPTINSVARHPEREHARPWFVWTFAYILLIAVVLLRWEGRWEALAYPLNCIVFHTAVGILALLPPKKAPVSAADAAIM